MHPAIRRAFPRSWFDPVIRGLAKTGLTPNAVSWIGFFVTAIAAVLAGFGQLAAAGWVSLLGGGLDMLDGGLARATGQTSRFGAVLDSTLDRYGEAVIIAGIFVYGLTGMQQDVLALAFATMVGSFMVSYIKSRAETLGYDCEVGWLTRPERVVIIGLGLATGLLVPALWVTAVLANVTAIHRLIHVWREAARNPAL